MASLTPPPAAKAPAQRTGPVDIAEIGAADDRAGEVSVLSAELTGERLEYKTHMLLAPVGPNRRSGFAYAVAIPFVGAGMLAYAAVRAAKGRAA